MKKTVRTESQIGPVMVWALHAVSEGIQSGKPVVVDVRREKRSDAQNRRLWAMLADVADQVLWHGQRYSKENWKIILMHAHIREQKLAPGIDGGILPLGYSSSAMTVHEMSDLQTIIEKFGAEQGVQFSASGRYEWDTSPMAPEA